MWKDLHKYGLGAALLAGVTALGAMEARAQTPIEQLAADVTAYPTTKVTLSIVDRIQITAPGGACIVNRNDVCKFKVRIRNNGHLNMRLVSVHIKAFNGVQVSHTAQGPWGTAIDSPFSNMNIDAHDMVGKDSEDFYFKAPPSATSSVVQLIQATIHDWSANLDHILHQHADFHPPTPTPPGGVFSAQVLGN